MRHGQHIRRWTLLAAGGFLLLTGELTLTYGYPGGGPGFVLLPRTHATPSCAG